MAPSGSWLAPRPEPKRRERGERDRDKAFGSIREEKTETREIPKMEKTHPNLGRREGLRKDCEITIDS